MRKISALHAALRRFLPRADRIAVALYDARSGRIGTFLSHGDRPTPLALYETAMTGAPALRRVLRTRRIRVVDDLDVFAKGRHEHTRAIRDGGYKTGVTFPIVVEGRVEGFVFVNSRRRAAFAPADLPLLEVFAHLAAGVAMARVRAARMLRAALRTAGALVHYRDPETGSHLERMARYCRVIAQELSRSGRRRFDDERIQSIEDFAPLHDVGKIGIPDRILLKPGPLDRAERRIMRTHAAKGRLIVDSILRRFGTASRVRSNALRQIAEHHHEAMDGSGYPGGLRGGKIAIEARIAAVADIFDALSSKRPYKRAWSLDRSFAELERLGRSRLDGDCVRALIKNRSAVERIRRRFQDGPLDVPLRRPVMRPSRRPR